MIEGLGGEVRLLRPGAPSAIFEPWDCFGAPADVAVLCCHGDESGIIFAEMADGADVLVLPDNRIAPSLLAEKLKGVPPVVVSTGCDTGHRAYADAFFASGARIYVAPNGYPDGASVPVLLQLALYRVIHAKASWPAAIKAANSFFTLENGFTAFSS
jgi:hypothetical protein